MADYIANPAIVKKNKLILNELTSAYLPHLQQNEGRLPYILKHLDKHI